MDSDRLKAELEELEASLESTISWEPQNVGESIAGVVELVAPMERGFLVHLRDKAGQLWTVYGIARDIRDFIGANGLDFGDLFAIRYLGSNTNQVGIKYKMYSCAVRKD